MVLVSIATKGELQYNPNEGYTEPGFNGEIKLFGKSFFTDVYFPAIELY